MGCAIVASDLPGINTPLITALAGKLPTSHAGTGGAAHALAIAGGAAGFMSGTDKTRLDTVDQAQVVAWNAGIIPLDRVGAGKRIQPVQLVGTGALALSVGSSPQEDGNCTFCIVGNGSATLDTVAFKPGGGGYTFNPAAGQQNIYSAIYLFGSARLYGELGTLSAVAPSFVSAAIANASPADIVITYSSPLGTATTSNPADVTLGNAGARTVASVTRVGNTLVVTANSAFVAGITPTVAVAAGKVYEASNTQAAGALAATPVTNNIVAPTAPVILTAVIDAATPSQFTVTFNKTLGSSTSTTAGDYSLGNAGGRGISSILRTGSALVFTVSVPFTGGMTPTFAIPVGKVYESTNTVAMVASSGNAITNNIPTATAPVIVSAVVQNGQPALIVVTFDQSLGASTSTTPADYVLAASGGRTVNNVTRVGSTLQLAVTAAFTSGVAPTLSIAAGKVFNSTGAVSNAAITARAITNLVGSGWTETWPGSAGAALPSEWTVVAGLASQTGDGYMNFMDGSGRVIRDAAIPDRKLTVGFLTNNRYGSIVFRANSTGDNACYLTLHAGLDCLVFSEWVGSTQTNIVNGTHSLGANASEHIVEVTMSGTSIVVKLDGALDITATAAENLTNTYVGLTQGLSGSAPYAYGQVSAT